jgi:ferric-dicitrate binding protein FerR (iron transport regulator)
MRDEPLRPIFATENEVVAIGAAVTHYKTWLARSPEHTKEFQEVIALLDRFQQRLIQQTGEENRDGRRTPTTTH